MIRTLATVLAVASLVILTPRQAVASPDESVGAVGSALSLPQASTQPDSPAEIISGESICDATLREVVSRLPMDYGTEWRWAELDKAAGLYFPGRDVIALDVDLDCQWVGVVAAHEWAHQVQDLAGLIGQGGKIGGSPRFEVVAECAAREIASVQGWPHYDSYPEESGVTCQDVAHDVAALLSLV